jgi:hypothetical protein
MCLQFALDVSGVPKYRRCPSCGRWFERTPRLNRADRRTCSAACRTQHYRERQKRARKLVSEGKSVEQVAEALGSDAETVKGWVRGTKRKGGRP